MRNALKSAAMIAGFSLSLFAQSDRVPSGTEIVVRTNETIDARHPSDSRIYTATVDQDVRDRNGRVIIPRGSDAELVARDVDDKEIVLDLDSVRVDGRRYTVDAAEQSVVTEDNQKEGVGANKRTGKYVGGGAVIGSIIGAIAGGGKGAAIGAATGAGAGAVGQTVTRGGTVRLPSESLLTFRLDRGLRVDTRDSRNDRDRYRDDRYRDDRRRDDDGSRSRSR